MQYDTEITLYASQHIAGAPTIRGTETDAATNAANEAGVTSSQRGSKYVVCLQEHTLCVRNPPSTSTIS